MTTAKVAWNKSRTSSVVLAKLKEFTIRQAPNSGNIWQVKGWFNETNGFVFGEFVTEAEAQVFLQRIHDMYL